ncbi:S49 family peptidase [Pseudomonas putida]|uniref:S49 family peptidase n=1 Tax=Pseudomonas putida TaxID=303 RepID=UPI001F527913|nr:S49 family peptidase [Pseudomonas putida]MCI0910869.1 S49 family peptidase [Pseudomonas putida]
MVDEWKAPGSETEEERLAREDREEDERVERKSWKLLEKTVLASVQEQRRARRWGIFFKLLTFVYLFGVLALFLPWTDMDKAASRGTNHTALVEVRGVIADQEAASADNLVKSLREAFKDPKTKAVIMRINSPGGSPVQAGYVYDEIRRLRGEYPDIKLYAVIADLGASGAYYIASAADEIYADKASLVGSIGVTAAGYGFVGSMEKLGIERRTYTAGEHKAFLDPFSPEKPEERAFWQGVLNTTHQQFIAMVKQGRGDRLKDKEHPELFSGLVWSGEQAKALGLVDGLGSASYVAREIVGEKELVDFTVEESPFDRFSKRLGASVAEKLALYMGFQGPALR